MRFLTVVAFRTAALSLTCVTYTPRQVHVLPEEGRQPESQEDGETAVISCSSLENLIVISTNKISMKVLCIDVIQ